MGRTTVLFLLAGCFVAFLVVLNGTRKELYEQLSHLQDSSMLLTSLQQGKRRSVGVSGATAAPVVTMAAHIEARGRIDQEPKHSAPEGREMKALESITGNEESKHLQSNLPGQLEKVQKRTTSEGNEMEQRIFSGGGPEGMESTNIASPQRPNQVTSVLSIPLSEYQNETSPVKDLLKIYVYDLDPDFTDPAERCAVPAYLSGEPQHVAKEDYRAEIALINLFKTFPGRTYNPKGADIYVVPYPHAAHCLCTKNWKNKCEHVPKRSTQKLLNSLEHYTKHTRGRHLFIVAAGKDLAHSELVNMPLTLATGPRTNHSDDGTIIISQFNDLPDFQPSRILERSEEWWTRERHYAFAYLSSRTNGRMRGHGGRRLRKGFDHDVASWSPGTKIGGKPFFFYSLQFQQFNKSQAYSAYRDSVLCPALPGDTSWQRRFYDVVMSGCIPLVLVWKTPSYPGGKSYWIPEGVISMQRETFSVSQTYPFAKGLFPDELAIDYSSFVLEVEGMVSQIKNMSRIRPAMESLLRDPEEVKRRQLKMKEYAVLFSMGVGADAHRYEDQFARLIRVLKRHLDNKMSYIRKISWERQKKKRERMGNKESG